MATERDKGTLNPDRDVPLATFLTRWLESAQNTIRPKTYVTYKMYVDRHIAPSLGRIYLRKLSVDHVQSMLNRKLAGGMAPQTVAHIRAILRRALNRAMRFGLVAQNVAVFAEPPKVERKEIAALSAENARRLLATIQRDRLRGLYLLAILTGMRQGELLGLRWQDVDFDRREIRVVVALQRQGGELRLVPPKTAMSRRVVPLTAMADRVLRDRWGDQQKERWLAGSRWVDTGLVFTTRHGTPLESGNVLRAFKGLLRAAELPPMRFHDLRHSCATLLVAAGVPARVIMEILGHSQISLTMNTYSHPSVELQRDALDKLEKLLGGGQDGNEDHGTAGAVVR